MSDRELRDPSPEERASSDEIVRLNKVVRALMDRAERSTSAQGSDFSLFQTTIMLEEQVRRRTAELEAALREIEKVNRDLSDSEAKFRGIVDQSLVGIAIVEHGLFSYTNSKLEDIFGYAADEMRRLCLSDLALEADRTTIEDFIRNALGRESTNIERVIRALHKKGDVLDIEIHASAMEIDGERALICLVLDVTRRMRIEREVLALQEKLREQSTRDPLTGLYNRRFLEESLDRELISAFREGYPVSVIFSDIDHFKLINDNHGHSAGDEVLRAFANTLMQHSRGSDIFCRYGGEEFLLVLPRMEIEGAIERAGQLCELMAAAPLNFGALPVAVTASFGVASFPRDGSAAGEVIAAADRALYAAKMAGRNCVRFCTEADAQ